MNPRQAKKYQRRFSTLVVFGLLVSSLTFVAQVVTAPPAKAANPVCVEGTHFTKSFSAGYVILKFINTSATCDWTVPSGVVSTEVAVVGGGGSGGGNQQPGGGGGGQVLHNPNYSVTPSSSLAITVGAGGNSATGNNTGIAGGDTSFGSITAKGGGGGGGGSSYWANFWNGSTGGSSGGSSRNGRAPKVVTQNTYTGWTSFGNSGGSGAGIAAQYSGDTATDGGTTELSATGAGAGGGGAASVGGDGQAVISGTSATITGGRGGHAIYLIDTCLGGGGGGGYRKSRYYNFTSGAISNAQAPGCKDVSGNEILGLSSGGIAPKQVLTLTGASSSGTTINVTSTSDLWVGAQITKNTGEGTGTGALSTAGNTVVTAITSATQFTVNLAPATTLSSAALTAASGFDGNYAGTSNTGGGGGAGATNSGAGGSGVVLVKYLNSQQTPTSSKPTATTTQYAITEQDSSPWTVPNGVTSISATVIGGGGGGGAPQSGTSQGGHGGSGGGIAISNLAVTPGETLILDSGVGGNAGTAGTAGSNGGTSSLIRGSNSAILVSAEGGRGGPYMNFDSCSYTLGGNGLVGTTLIQGGRAGCGHASTLTTVTTGYQTYSVGGAGGSGSSTSPGTFSTTYGSGGGGGSYRLNTLYSGSNGQKGAILISYTVPDSPTVDLSSTSDSGASSTDNLTATTTPRIDLINRISGSSVLVTATLGSTVKTCEISAADSSSFCSLPTLTDGAWVVTATQTLNGNTSQSSSSITVTVDTGAAPPTIDSSPSSGRSTSATVAFTGEDGASFECKLDSGSYSSCTSPKTFTGIADGVHTISVRQRDVYGHTSTAATTSSWIIDATSPGAPTITSSPSSGTSTSATVAFTGENGASFECKLDSGSYSPCTSPKAFDQIADGAHTISVRQTDSYGNIGGVATTSSWTVDTTAPSAPTITSSPSSGTSTSATVAFTGEVGATFECKIDSDPFLTCTSPVILNGLTDGAHTFYVQQTDSFGNTGAARTANWTIDSTAPSVAISSASQSNSATPTISGTAEAGSDVTVVVAGATYVTTATNGTWSVNLATATRSSGTLNLNTNGSNSVSVVATDSYGNNSAAVTQSLLIDTVAPSVVSKSSPSTPTNSAELIFTITFSEAVTGLTSTDFNLTGTSCTINTISGSTTVYTIKITNCADGVTVGLELKSNRVEDALSNTGPATDSAFTSVVIDRTAPTVSITSTSSTKVSRPTLSGTTENGAQISISIGSAIYQFTASSSAWSLNLNTSFTTSGTLSLNSNGSNLVTVTATDSAGNSATTTQTLLIDTVSPTVSKKDSPRTPSTSLSLTFIVRFSETITGLDASDFFVSGGFCQVTNVTADSGSYLIALTSCVDSKPISLMLQANSVSDTLGNFGPSQNETFTTIYTDTTYVEPVAVAPKNESAKVAEKPVQILKKPEIVKPVDKQLQQKEVQVALMEKLETSDLNFNVKLVSEERQQELVMSPLLITVEKQFFALASVQVEGSTKYVVITTRTPLLNPLVLM